MACEPVPAGQSEGEHLVVSGSRNAVRAVVGNDTVRLSIDIGCSPRTSVAVALVGLTAPQRLRV
jgi:hypothetical protein